MNNITLNKNTLLDMTSFLSCNEDDKIEIMNPFIKKRMRIKREFLLDVIYQIETGSLQNDIKKELEKVGLLDKNNNADSNSNDLIDHWKKRNWSFSLDYYNWTRDIEFEDNGINYNNKRKEALNKYINEEGFPPEPRTIHLQQEAIYLKKIPLSEDEECSFSFGDVLLRRTTVEQFSLEVR